MVFMLWEPSNDQRQLYVPPALSISTSAFSIYVFHMILSVNGDYFLKQR
jgi:hypothetical protein